MRTNINTFKLIYCFSLGITILELASDLDLPRGGDLWHELRSGKLPDEFLVGKKRFLVHYYIRQI